MLTRERAETLRNYLVVRGIDKKRVGVMGWGSIDMLTASTAKDADLNERIEIELVRGKRRIITDHRLLVTDLPITDYRLLSRNTS
jgi:hypothetical protein